MFLRSCVIAVILALFPLFQRIILAPLYFNHGIADAILPLINRIAAMVVLPGKTIVYQVWPPVEHHFSTPQMALATVFNLGIYFMLIWTALQVFAGRSPQTVADVRNDNPESNEGHDSLVSQERRAFLKTTASAAAGFSVILAGSYPVLIAPGRIRVRRETVAIKGLPDSLNGLTIAQLTDIHHDEWISLHHIRESVNLANSLKPDIVTLTGDYVTSNAALIKPCIKALAELRPKIGTVGVLGNHDWWADPKATRARLTDAGVAVVDNGRIFVDAQKRMTADATGGVCIGGVGDLWEDKIEPEKAFHRVPPEMPRLLLSHNPDVAEHQSLTQEGLRVDLMISGHTHGGQVRLPGMGTPIVPSSFGSKYAQGLVKGPVCPVQISAGIGLAMLPVRLNVQPEIVLMTLTSA